MLRSIEINNFRGLQDVKLEKFGDINIIVGDNGSGKTSLLEAIFLSMCNHVQSVIQIRNLRYAQNLFFNISNDDPIKSMQDFFAEMFYNLEVKNNIFIKGNFIQDAKSIGYTFLVKRKQDSDIFSSAGRDLLGGTAKQSFQQERKNQLSIGFDFVWTDGNEQQVISPTVSIRSDGISFNSNPSNIDIKRTFVKGLWVSERDNLIAEKFSDLTSKQKQDFREFLGLEEMEVKILRDGPAICGRERNSTLTETLPLFVLSNGLSKIANILISAVSAPRGAILVIDEIENGIFYGRYPKLIQYLNKLAKERSIQFFITTHSKEFVASASEAINDEETKFSLIKMSKNNPVIYNEDILQAVIETKKEFR